MKLENQTPLAAHLFHGADGENGLGCTLIAKATYRIAGGRLEPVTEAAWPIHLTPLETPYGTFPGEVAPRKPKCDVIVLGKAKPASGTATAMTATVSVGSFRHTLAIFGNRVWERSAVGHDAAEPEPFAEMPITWENAYGGVVKTPVFDMPSTDNPVGKGFILEPKDADGVPLPNVEDPHALIRSPKDMPRTVGWGPYPLAGGVRASRFFTAERKPRSFEEMEPYVMGWAHPDLIIDTPAAGTRIEVVGLTREGPLVATVPNFPGRVMLVVGEEERKLAPKLDTIIVQAEERRLVCRWRAAARFEMRPREVRLVRIEG